MRDPDVAIVGCGVISAVGGGVESLHAALKNNASGLRANERFSSPRFQSNVVGAASIDSNNDNPAHVLASLALREAISATKLRTLANPFSPSLSPSSDGERVADRPSEGNWGARLPLAGLLSSSIAPERTGLVLCTTKANIEALERVFDGRPCSDSARRHLQAERLAADLAAEHGARGPVQTISAACVSGLMALMQGVKLIQRGAADAVLVVGVDHLSAFVVAGFTALKALDPNGCRPFDRDRCGLSPGEAGAAIILVRGDLAPRPVTTIRGWGLSNDANHMTGPSRDGSGLAQAIRAALNSVSMVADQIDYVNAHGTGTPYNDAMESAALRSVFGAACPPVSGLKGMLGHTLGAAGVIETVACVLAMRDSFLPGTPQLVVPAEFAPASLIRDPRPASRLHHVLKLNTGFGGVNGALILSHA